MCCVLAILAAMSVSSFAAPVTMFGKVTDSLSGAVLDNVVITLAKQKALSDTTDANGLFSISGQTSGVLSGIVAVKGAFVRCVGHNVHLTVQRPARVSVETFGVSGKLLAKPIDGVVAPGAYRVPVGLGIASQMIFVRVTCDGDVRMLRMWGAMSRGKFHIKSDEVSPDHARLFKVAAAAAVDTLAFSRGGFAVKKVAVASYTPADTIRVSLKPMPFTRWQRKLAGGTFSVGSAGTADTVHSVTVSGFYMDTTEVTQADFKLVTGRNPSKYSTNLQKPVENVTWFDAVLYCNALSKRYGFDTAYTFTSRRDSTNGACLDLGGIAVDIKKKAYRLPTGAEWEFACRGGTTTAFYWGADSSNDSVSKYAWFKGNVTADSTHPVAGKKPNAFGLYDMSGNVWEWCTDQWKAYGGAAQTDPCVLAAPAGTVNLKGGDFLDPASKITSGLHTGAQAPAALQLQYFGFRVALTAMYADSEYARDNFITFEATPIKDTANTAVATWYNGTYLSGIMGYSGCKGSYRMKNLGGFNNAFVPAYWTIFRFTAKADQAGLDASSQAVAARGSMATTYADSQIVRSWDVSYEKLKSWENPGAGKPLVYATIVGTAAKAEFDSVVNAWEINFHVPWLMNYTGLSKVVRYRKIDGTGANVTQMPKYIEIFYYSDKAGFEGQGADASFQAAEADRVATWKNGELDIPFVFNGQIVQELKK
jgi:formylglycine-generating enzyme required for sulfatase activity